MVPAVNCRWCTSIMSPVWEPYTAVASSKPFLSQNVNVCQQVRKLWHEIDILQEDKRRMEDTFNKECKTRQSLEGAFGVLQMEREDSKQWMEEVEALEAKREAQTWAMQRQKEAEATHGPGQGQARAGQSEPSVTCPLVTLLAAVRTQGTRHGMCCTHVTT